MGYKERWHIISEIDEGGQGKVYRVRDNNKFNIDGTNGLFETIVKFIQEFSHDTNFSVDDKNLRESRVVSFRKAVAEIIQMEDPVNHGALKVLRNPEDAVNAERAEDRIKSEVEAMTSVSHPNLLNILDYDQDWDLDTQKWFVSEYHPKGTLIDNKDLFTGNFVGSLRAFRPLVEGVSQLHKDGWVHRDIKPKNVFLDSNNNLVLGDFGLVFSMYEEHTRISDMWENVGSRDWMPGWAMGMRIKDIKPTFDVFGLGKLLWAMVSNTPILQLWYYYKPQFNLEQMFPDAPYINLAKKLFENCIVENEEDCLPDATALLKEIDIFLTIIDRNSDWVAEGVVRPCKVCGIGNYEQIVDKDYDGLEKFGFNRISGLLYKIFTCNHCGHVQLFHFPSEQNPPDAWPFKEPIRVKARRKSF